jgi:DNA-binding NarL/FixJ family response regulator
MQRKVVVIDDHPIVSNSITLCLTPSGFNVEVAETAKQARKHLSGDVDIVILDIGLPDADGVGLINEIARRNLPVLVFSGNKDWATIRACARNGAKGYVRKTSNPDALLGCINKILAGETVFPEDYLQAEANNGAPYLEKIVVTKREREVLEWSSIGKTSAEIGLILGISENTVNIYKVKLGKKLNTSRMTQTLMRATELGLLS